MTMWTCKQVGEALAEHRYRDLPLLRRIGLRLHVALCVVCHRYNKQVMQMQDLAAGFACRETEGGDAAGDPALDAEARKRLQDAVRRAGGGPA